MERSVIVTGCARGIGKALIDAFRAAGDQVYGIDLLENPYFQGDLAAETDLARFVEHARAELGSVDVLINNAMASAGGLDEADYEAFNRTLRIGVSAPYYLVRELPFAEGAVVINILSTRMAQSEANTESYSAAKGGLRALSHALMVTLAGKVRVNSIVPGWIDTTGSTYSGADAAQHPAGRVGTPEDIVKAAFYLVDNSFVNGEELFVDGGMSKLMIYHGDHGWQLTP